MNAIGCVLARERVGRAVVNLTPTCLGVSPGTGTASKSVTIVRFSGLLEDIKRQTFFEAESSTLKEKTLLTLPFIQLGGKSLNGLVFLQLIQDIPDDYYGSKTTESIHSSIKPLINGFWARRFPYYNLNRHMKRLIKAGCLEEKSGSGFYGYRRWQITDLGRKVLAEARTAKRVQAPPAPTKSPATKAKSPKRVSASPKAESPPITYETLKTEQLKALVNGQRNGESGWEMLHRLSEMDKHRFRLIRKFLPGQTQANLTAGLGSSSQGLEEQFTALEKQGFLRKVSAHPNPAKTRWQLSELGLRIVSLENPLKSGSLKPTDLQRVIQYDIDQLTAARQARENHLAELEKDHQKALKLVEETRNKMAKALEIAHEAKEKLEALEQQTNPPESELASLRETARKKAMEADLLNTQTEVETEMTQRLKQQVTLYQNIIKAWDTEAHKTMKQLMAAKFRTQTLSVDKNIAALMQELQAIESTHLDGKKRLESQIEALDLYHFTTQAQLDQLGSAAKADAIVSDNLLKDLLKALPVAPKPE